MQKFAALVVILGLVWGSQATNPHRVVYPFPLSSLLECHVPNPFASLPGQPSTIIEEIPRIPIQPGPPGTVWLPEESGFRLPTFGYVDERELINFLGPYLNPNHNALQRPSNVPELPSLIVEGSAGQMTIVTPEPVTPDFGSIPDLTPERQLGIEAFIEQYNLGLCPIMVNWTLLPESFFPRWYTAGYCSGNNCSFPLGLTCEPDISPDRLVYSVEALRWDCCWNFENRQWRWDCGWRRVRIPIVVFCECICTREFRPTFYPG